MHHLLKFFSFALRRLLPAPSHRRGCLFVVPVCCMYVYRFCFCCCCCPFLAVVSLQLSSRLSSFSSPFFLLLDTFGFKTFSGHPFGGDLFSSLLPPHSPPRSAGRRTSVATYEPVAAVLERAGELRAAPSWRDADALASDL